MSKKIFELEARLVKSLAHSGRLEIIHLLRHHTLTVSQIVSMLGKRQAYVSQQLSILKKSKIIDRVRSGKEMYYKLVDPRITVACDSIHSLVSDAPVELDKKILVTDPICHMEMPLTKSTLSFDYNGVRHYFCGKGCLKQFNSKRRRV